jgi:hypothetical protein
MKGVGMDETRQPSDERGSFKKLPVKTRVFIIAGVFSICLIVGAVAIVLPQVSKLRSLRASLGGSSEASSESSSGTNTNSGSKRQSAIRNFFNADGSVNIAKVNEVKSEIPPEFSGQLTSRITPLIDDSVSDGTITQSQANALKSAFGI